MATRAATPSSLHPSRALGETSCSVRGAFCCKLLQAHHRAGKREKKASPPALMADFVAIGKCARSDSDISIPLCFPLTLDP